MANINIDNENLPPPPVRSKYDKENKFGYCPLCQLDWKLEQQIPYTTRNKTRTFGMCPKCLNKHPLRKKPRKKTNFRLVYPEKRIE